MLRRLQQAISQFDLKKILQQELFQIGITAAAVALAVWLAAKLGAALLAALATIAAIVLMLALALAGVGAIKNLLEQAGISTDEILQFLRQGLEQIAEWIRRAVEALQEKGVQ